MPNLTPELRPDRDGKLVTRWVKSDAQGQQVTIPAPFPAAATTPRARKETMGDLEEFFRNFQISRKYPYAQVLRRNVALMSEGNASELVHGLWEDFNCFGNPEAVAGTLERIYGEESVVPEAHRDIVFKNLVDIIPPYGMNYDDENNDILEYTWVIFDAVGGKQTTAAFTEEDKIVYQSAACVTNHIFKVPSEAPDDLEGNGFTRVGANEDELALGGTGAIDALRENINIIQPLRESLMERRTFHPEIIQEMANTGILGEGVL